MMNEMKRRAYDEILGIFRMMVRVNVDMYVIPFRMAEIIKEWDISDFEVSMLRREAIYEYKYKPD